MGLCSTSDCWCLKSDKCIQYHWQHSHGQMHNQQAHEQHSCYELLQTTRDSSLMQEVRDCLGFTVHWLTDASQLNGLSFALLQLKSTKHSDGKSRLLQASSRSCSVTERRYILIEQKCLAAI